MIPRGNITTVTKDEMIAARLGERTVYSGCEGQRGPLPNTTHKAPSRNLVRFVIRQPSNSDEIQMLSQRLRRTQEDEASGRHHHITPHLECRAVCIMAIEHRVGIRRL
jgi:hypothetical protein